MTNQDPKRILTARFYTDEKRHHIPGWSFDDLARLKLIKDTATRLWRHHHPANKPLSLMTGGGNTECKNINYYNLSAV